MEEEKEEEEQEGEEGGKEEEKEEKVQDEEEEEEGGERRGPSGTGAIDVDEIGSTGETRGAEGNKPDKSAQGVELEGATPARVGEASPEGASRRPGELSQSAGVCNIDFIKSNDRRV